MKPYPHPSGALLPEGHRPFLANLLRTLSDIGFLQSKLKPLQEDLTDAWAALCSTDGHFAAWCDELERWVRWRRGEAYWLTYVFQETTEKAQTLHHIRACDLFAQAQTNFADDWALASLETAYRNAILNRQALGKAFDVVRNALAERLRAFHTYYYEWSQPFDYASCNPCSDHLYTQQCASWLLDEVNDSLRINDPDVLRSVINEANHSDFAHQKILARHLLGQTYSANRQHDLAAQEFILALNDARELRLDTEIGHLCRLLGLALSALGQHQEAYHYFDQALAFERLQPFFTHTAYWQAISARELGDTIMRQAGRLQPVPGRPHDAIVVIDDVPKLKGALNAYHDGRMFFSAHLDVQSPAPVARSAKQQLIRSFAGNALQVAAMLQKAQAALAEVEANGPREASEITTEIAAARRVPGIRLGDFRKGRALFFKGLGPMKMRFEDYLEQVAEFGPARRAYLKQNLQLTSLLLERHTPDDVAERFLSLRLPNTLFLLFHLTPQQGFYILVDSHSGNAAVFPMPFGEAELAAIHDEYLSGVDKASDITQARSVLDRYLSQCSALFEPVFAEFLQLLPGMHLKIFPRLQMNAVPFHALTFASKHLIDHCGAVSYGQTLALFLENHSAESEACNYELRMVMGADVDFYELVLPAIQHSYGARSVVERQPSWPSLLQAISAHPARDTVFACHGVYRPDNPSQSYLEAAGGATFQRVFEELDLKGCRSVVMGACESGLVRTHINAEYVGLPGAMLASGVRYVIGALWQINALASAILVERFLKLIRDGVQNVPASLCQCQREIRALTFNEFRERVTQEMPPGKDRDALLKDVATLGDPPFAHPYFWAGLETVGDL